ncbi:hypothetical protein ACFE04_030141 [Oxalis oulophora]
MRTVRGAAKDLPLQWSIALRADRRKIGPEPSRWLRRADGMAVLHSSPTRVSEVTNTFVHFPPSASIPNATDHGRGPCDFNKSVFNAEMDNISNEDNPFLVHEGEQCEVVDRLIECRCSLLAWSRSLSMDVRGEIKKLERDITHVRNLLGVSSNLDDAYIQKKSRLKFLVAQEDAKWRQRAKIFWLQSGDLNSRFFHLHASGRNRRNVIQGLYGSDGLWTVDQDAMQSIAYDYFSTLFIGSEAQFQQITQHVSPVLQDTTTTTIEMAEASEGNNRGDIAGVVIVNDTTDDNLDDDDDDDEDNDYGGRFGSGSASGIEAWPAAWHEESETMPTAWCEEDDCLIGE